MSRDGGKSSDLIATNIFAVSNVSMISTTDKNQDGTVDCVNQESNLV